MNSETKNKIAPKLRFPEFKENSEWELLPIGNKVDPISGFPFTSTEISEDVSGLPLMRGINITEGYIRHSADMDRYFLGDIQKFEKFKLQVGDLVIGMDGSKVGKNSALITESDSGSLLIQRVARLRTTEEGIIKFIFQHINSTKFHSYVDRINTSGGIPHISLKQIEEFKIYFPPTNEEQQKIADCLSSLDDFIAAQNQKLEALEAHKKGLIQQLFPAEGETVPKLRFEEFRDSADWEEKILNEVALYENGKAHEQDIVEEGEYIVVNSKFISSDGEVKKYTNTAFCLAAKDDILMVLSDVPNGKAIAKCFFVDTDNLYSVNQRICKITAFDANSHMLFYILNRNSYFLSFDDGVKQTNLRNDDVLNCPFLLPKDREEQQRIGDCLSSLDELITAQTEKVEELKRHKNGLMQGLFPNVNDANV